MKKPIYYQDDEASCASACIQMILAFFKRKVELKEIKRYCKSNDNGTTVYGIIQCFKHYQISAKAYHATNKEIEENFEYPCIVHLLIKEMYHYVVVYEWKKEEIIIGDPGVGIVHLSRKDFQQMYQETVVMIEEVGIFEEEENYKSMTSFYFQHFFHNKTALFKIIVLSILLMLGNIVLSYYFQLYIDVLLDSSISIFIFVTFFFIAIQGMKTTLQYYHQLCLEYMHKENNEMYVLNTMQTMLYLEPKDIIEQKEGVLLNKIKGLSTITSFMSQVYSVLFVDSFLVIGVFVVIYILDQMLAILLVLFFLSSFICSYYLMKKIQESNRKKIEKEDKVNTVFLEGCRNLLMIQQFSFRGFFKEKIQHYYLADQYYEVEKNKAIYQLQFIMEIIVQAMMYGTFLYCYYLYSKSKITIGNILYIYMLLGYCMEPVIKLVSVCLELKQQTVLFTRYKELLPNKKTKKKKIKKIHSLECSYITYSYDYHHTIFSKYDLVIDESIVLQGENGSGKTTLLYLLMGYDFVDGGQVLVNGIDIKEIDLASYYQRIIYLSKNPVFFHETVLFNLVGYHNERRKEVLSLLEYFQCEDIVNRIDTRIQENSFSSGQLQLIMLVRAFLRKPDILLIDEAISHIDEKKVKIIFEYIEKHLKNMKIIIVSHHTKLVNLPSKYVIINKI